MGKQSKAQEAAERRKYMEAKRREEEETQKKQNRLMWQIVIAVVAVLLIVVIVAIAITLGGKNKLPELEGYTTSKTVTDYVRMNITYTDKNGQKQTGDIVVRLRPDKAPITVENFQNLVSEGFYDGLTFHRIVESFMIQGGDPDGNGSGGSPNTIKGEFSSNGVENDLEHKRGVISMARTNDPDSATSQFFIVHEESENNHLALDGNYAAFGSVIYGMDTVDGIAQTEVKYGSSGEKSTPVNPVTINKMCFVTPNES